MNIKYLNYLFKKEKNTNLVLVILALMLYPFVALTTRLDFGYMDAEQIFYMQNNLSNVFIVFIYVLSIVMVVVNFGYLHSKRSADTYMQLPLSKTEIFITKLVYTLLQVIVVAVVCFVLGNVILSLRGMEFYGNYVLFSCVVMIIGLSLLIFINSYIYQLCNNMIDGIIVVLMYHGLFMLLDFFLNYKILSYNQVSMDSLFSVDLTFFNALYSKFSYQSLLLFDGFTMMEIRAIILFGIMGIAALIMSVRDIRNRASERADQITDSHFCYPVIIISYASLLYMLMMDIYYYDFSDLIFSALLIFIPYIIGMFIYNRRVMIKRKYIITYVVIILASGLFTYLLDVTGSFGLKYITPSSYEQAVARVSYYSDDMDKNYKTYLEQLDINKEIEDGDYDYYYDPPLDETLIYYDGRIIISSSNQIETFEELLLDSYKDNESSQYRDYTYGYAYITISYYDSMGDEYDRRYADVNMDKNELEDFINSLE